MYIFYFTLYLLHTLTNSQYPPVSQLKTVTSPVDNNIIISFKTPPKGTCQTVFDTQEQYTGWVKTPSSYDTNIFFWFFAARDPTDQVVIWLNGGPGSSSMVGLFTENGPCEVIDLANGKFGTREREWGWDRGANILYIDQPNQVGFSYDTPTNGSLDLLTQDIYVPPQVISNSQPSATFINGTFSSLNKNNTANTTQSAGIDIWHMLQGFVGAFPQYSKNGSMSVHLFTESYGGKYGPEFAMLWENQNQKRLNGTISENNTFEIKVKSLGIINGCIDDLVQAPYWPLMAVNNSYGLTTINPVRANLALTSFHSPGGCKDLILQCRALVGSHDPHNTGNSDEVNKICIAAYNGCSDKIMTAYLEAGRSIYDIALVLPDTFPPGKFIQYLNTDEVLTAIGSPVNFTQNSEQVATVFAETGDYERQTPISDIASLLRLGIRVGFIYGDRDYICNWYGGEAISLAVAKETTNLYASNFPAAGYAPIVVNSSYIGGVVRQYGNLSFSRIYDAGHYVPAYQPETAFQVYARIIQGNSVSTGKPIDLSNFNTTGPLNATHTNSLPDSPIATCYMRNIPETCTDDQKRMLLEGHGIILNGIFYKSLDDYRSAVPAKPLPDSVGSVTVTTKTEILTGFFTATSTPSSNKKSFAIRSRTPDVLLIPTWLLIMVFI